MKKTKVLNRPMGKTIDAHLLRNCLVKLGHTVQRAPKLKRLVLKILQHFPKVRRRLKLLATGYKVPTGSKAQYIPAYYTADIAEKDNDQLLTIDNLRSRIQRELELSQNGNGSR